MPQWIDQNGDYGKLTVLRLEGIKEDLPKKPFMIRKSVESFLGVKIKDAFPEKKGVSYIIRLRNQKQVEKLKSMAKLADGSEIKIAEHPTLNQTRCVISCEESKEYETEELKAELQDQGVIGIRRITRRVNGKDTPTPTIILTIEGTVVPQSIYFGWVHCRTRPYYPSPMLCYGCFEYGHPKARCKSQISVCGNCSGNHLCSTENPCNEQSFCKHCKENSHPVSSKKCPVYLKETEIQHIRIDEGISYPQARRIWETEHRQKNAANVVNESNDQRFAELNNKFDKLLVETGKTEIEMKQMRKEMATKDQKIDLLISALKQRDQLLVEKEARIAALEAALAAANIQLPATTPAHQILTTNSYSATSDVTISKNNRRSQQEKGSKDRLNKEGTSSSNLLDRLELTRSNGTIEDLVKENQNLKAIIAKKQTATLQPQKGKKKQLEKTSSTESGSKKPKESESTKAFSEQNKNIMDTSTSDDESNALKAILRQEFDVSSDEAMNDPDAPENLP